MVLDLTKIKNCGTITNESNFMTIKKQVVLDGVALDAYNKLKESLPFISDSHLIRGALIAASRLDTDAFRWVCTEANLRVGRPLEKR